MIPNTTAVPVQKPAGWSTTTKATVAVFTATAAGAALSSGAGTTAAAVGAVALAGPLGPVTFTAAAALYLLSQASFTSGAETGSKDCLFANGKPDCQGKFQGKDMTINGKHYKEINACQDSQGNLCTIDPGSPLDRALQKQNHHTNTASDIETQIKRLEEETRSRLRKMKKLVDEH